MRYIYGVFHGNRWGLAPSLRAAKVLRDEWRAERQSPVSPTIRRMPYHYTWDAPTFFFKSDLVEGA